MLDRSAAAVVVVVVVRVFFFCRPGIDARGWLFFV
jgi:hypothetical protein